MSDFFDPTQNPVGFAIPFFVLTILLELAALRWLDHDDNVTGYAFKDARTSILMGLGSLVTTLVFKLAFFWLFVLLYEKVAPSHLPDTWWAFVLTVVLVDLSYYWQHRFVHRARVGWAAHQAHHSSEYMNFGTALRQKWNPWFDVFFLLPLPLLGASPGAMYVALGINLVFQFFVHTEVVDRLPRPIELVFNTPSHHRVHHGSDPIYLDRNYAGILIVWDRLFGTFQPELHRPRYGLTHPVDTYHLITLEYGHYADLWRDLRAATSWRDRLGHLFRPPGWVPQRREEPRVADAPAS
jgi:sterol desaturase/sphingolipid hydroxylase (fatty acid hydroxylase superfamily)